jgi:flagellar hook-associated protein 1 FlgK
VSILTTLSIGAQSLKNQQLNIHTTGHNISNANIPGFSRQRVELSTEMPLWQGVVLLGQGSKATGVQRVIDRFLEASLLTIHRDLGSAEAERQTMASIQDVFPTNGGLEATLGAFFNGLSDLANNPAGIGERVNVIGKAETLGENLRHTRELLTASQDNLDDELADTISRVNVLTGQIAELNEQISFTEAGLAEANDFRDQRQNRVLELVRLTGATVREEANGHLTISVSGLPLVSGSRAATLDSSTRNPAGFRQVLFEGSDGLSFDATGLLGSEGKIGTILELRDKRVQAFIGRLDEFAFTLVSVINSQHSLGFDLSGTSGRDFFTSLSSSIGAAALVRVDATIATNPRAIAAAASAATLPGDNRNILALLKLGQLSNLALGNLTFQESYSDLLSDLGNQAESAQTKLDFREALLKQTQARREAVSGVSIDEEMTKMISFQRAFEASSLLVQTADEMYYELIEMTR